MTHSSNAILEQPFGIVKSDIINSSSSDPDSMIHHKSLRLPRDKRVLSYSMYGDKSYAVSPAKRVLSPQALLKRLDKVRDCLHGVLGLTEKQTEATIRLLRLWSYYGQVYPKASQVAGEPEISPAMISWRAEQGLGPAPQNDGVSRATFWRTIRILEDLGLVQIVNRYVVREHARISNLYRLDKLVLVLAKYLAERIEHAWPSWIIPHIKLTWAELWGAVSSEDDIYSRALQCRASR